MTTGYCVALLYTAFVQAGGTAHLPITKEALSETDKTVPAQKGSLDYVGSDVPFARAASGIQIYGDAWTWWSQAAGKYERGSIPRVGAVVVFAKSDLLRVGHVAVVSRVIEPRVLMLAHANRSRIGGDHSDLKQDATLFDVSAKNDWSQVRVLYRDDTAQRGSLYPVYGFIYSPNAGARPKPSGNDSDFVQSLIDAYTK